MAQIAPTTCCVALCHCDVEPAAFVQPAWAHASVSHAGKIDFLEELERQRDETRARLDALDRELQALPVQ
jgi:hypothetical protein